MKSNNSFIIKNARYDSAISVCGAEYRGNLVYAYRHKNIKFYNTRRNALKYYIGFDAPNLCL